MSIKGSVAFYDPETRQGIEAAFTKFEAGKFYCSAFAKSRTLETVGSYYKKAWGKGGWEHESGNVINLDYIKNEYSIIDVEDGLFFERCVIFDRWSREVHPAKQDSWKSYSLWYCSCNENDYSETTSLKSPCKRCRNHCSVVQAKCRPWRHRREKNDAEQDKKLLEEQAKICGEMGVPRGVPVPTKKGCGLNEYRGKKCRARYRGKKSAKEREEFKDKKDENEMIRARGNGKNKHLSHLLKKKNRNLGVQSKGKTDFLRFIRKVQRTRQKQRLILGDACDNILDERIPRKLTAKRHEFWY